MQFRQTPETWRVSVGIQEDAVSKSHLEMVGLFHVTKNQSLTNNFPINVNNQSSTSEKKIHG